MLFIFSALCFLLYICAGIFFYTWHRLHASVNIHVSAPYDSFAPLAMPYQTTSFETSDGLTIAAWDIPAKNPKAVVILVHGYTTRNGGKTNMLVHAKYLHAAGYSAFVIDLRAFGESSGGKVTFGVKEWNDLEAAYNYVRSLPGNKKQKVGFFGISMGAVAAIVAAGKTGKGDFIIASVPYANFKKLFHFQLKTEKLYPGIFLPFLRLAGAFEFGFKYESYSPACFIQNIHVPILLIGADKDEKVDSTDAMYLYTLANKPKELWQADTVHDVFRENPREFKKRVLNFLAAV